MMIRIALIGGSPGSSPNTKTSTSVPTPPQSPRPIPPERTPSAMKPMTTRPWTATSTQSIVVMTTAPPREAADTCSSHANAAASAGSREATPATVVTPLFRVTAIASVAARSCCEGLLEGVRLIVQRVLRVLEARD